MQVASKLMPMFSYSIIRIIVVLIIIIILLFILLYKPKKNNSVELSTKQKYMLYMDNLLNDVNSEKISSRKAYQKLSFYIRKFIHETTGIKVQNCTLEDIEKVNIPILYELVKEYYDPEFSNISSGNIVSSIEKTRGVIERWN